MQNRTTDGRYAKRRFLKTRIVLVLMVMGALAYGVYTLTKPVTITRDQSAQVDARQTELDEIKQRENFKKRIDNQAKQVFLSEQIADRQAKIAALEQEQRDLEAQLEATRHEELGF